MSKGHGRPQRTPNAKADIEQTELYLSQKNSIVFRYKTHTINIHESIQTDK